MKSIKLILFLILIISSSFATARTLRSYAQLSNALLALSDSESKNICDTKQFDISAKSQELKSLIDDKINSLSPSDMKTIESRISSCKSECTCDIYALAFEYKLAEVSPDTPAHTALNTDNNPDIKNNYQKSFEKFSALATTTTTSDRIKCLKKLNVKKICSQLRYL